MKLPRLVAPVLLGVVCSASPLFALDLTGTWDGSWSCSGFDGASYSTKAETSVLAITDLGGGVVRASIDGFYSYNVGVIPDDKNPGESGAAVFDECGADDLPLAGGETEIMRARVKLKPMTDHATFAGTSIFEDGFGSVGSCTYSYKRRDVVDPGVPPCP